MNALRTDATARLLTAAREARSAYRAAVLSDPAIASASRAVETAAERAYSEVLGAMILAAEAAERGER